MSNREKCIAILDSLTETQLTNIVTILQGARDAIAESADDAFCTALYEDYKADTDREDCISIEDAAAELGVSL